jgi:5-methylcytosine-specific restriction enzyme A
MPLKAQHPCNQPGCPQLTNERHCQQHTKNNVQADLKRHYDKGRKQDPHRKLYSTTQWARTRKAILARDPLCTLAIKCVERFGIAVPSTVVDHITPIRQGGDPYDAINLQGCCKACHDYKTATEDGGLGHKKQNQLQKGAINEVTQQCP